MIHGEIDVNTILDRLKYMMKYKSNSELARKMNVQISTLNSWKHRNSLDFSKIISFCKKHNINLNWALTGEGNPTFDKNEDIFSGIEAEQIKYILKDNPQQNTIQRRDKYKKELDVLLLPDFLDNLPKEYHELFEEKFNELDKNFYKTLLVTVNKLEKEKIELESKLVYANSIIDKLISK